MNSSKEPSFSHVWMATKSLPFLMFEWQQRAFLFSCLNGNKINNFLIDCKCVNCTHRKNFDKQLITSTEWLLNGFIWHRSHLIASTSKGDHPFLLSIDLLHIPDLITLLYILYKCNFPCDGQNGTHFNKSNGQQILV
jgi:hypothetical protein